MIKKIILCGIAISCIAHQTKASTQEYYLYKVDAEYIKRAVFEELDKLLTTRLHNKRKNDPILEKILQNFEQKIQQLNLTLLSEHSELLDLKGSVARPNSDQEKRVQAEARVYAKFIAPYLLEAYIREKCSNNNTKNAAIGAKLAAIFRDTANNRLKTDPNATLQDLTDKNSINFIIKFFAK